MPIYYNTHRFGPDEYAVGRLINGDLPTDDQERWSMVQAPRFRIRKLFTEHQNAQQTLIECSAAHKPFILFLRSFTSEHTGHRDEGFSSSSVITYSINLQKWIKQLVHSDGIPIIKLHGGSDSIFSEEDGEGNVLSTHSANWKSVASELIDSASVIVFLVSHLTAGVVEEFELIRSSKKMSNCVIIILDPKETFTSKAAEANLLRDQLADFPHVFELKIANSEVTYPDGIRNLINELTKTVYTPKAWHEAVNAGFTYLEPSFVQSDDFKKTETFIWRQLRLLRVLFDDNYWAALKKNDIPFQHFTFPGAWQVAHQVYGLSIVTADFKATQEALRCLHLLYIFLGKDMAFPLKSLEASFEEFAKQIYQKDEPDYEKLYASGPDPLSLSPTINVALKIVEYAESFAKDQDFENAGYLYQAAIIMAVKATDSDAKEKKWLIANMSRDWAKFQSSNQPEWAITNCSLSVKLFRDLAAIDPLQYNSSLALSLNNLGSLHFRRKNFASAELAFVEALKIRRTISEDSENYTENLYNSLANLGLLHAEIGKVNSAEDLYKEAIKLCQKRLENEPAAIIDLTRFLGWMSLCLRKIPERKKESIDYASQAEKNIPRVSQLNKETGEALQQFVQNVLKS